MSIKEEFFGEIVAQARREAEAAVVAATDPLHLKAAGVREDLVQRFIDDVRLIAEAPEFRMFMESIILSAYAGFLVSVDGLSATFDKKVSMMSLEGSDLGDDLHEDFIRFLIDRRVDW